MAFEPKQKVELEPPKDDVIGLDYLSKCDGSHPDYPTYVAIKVGRDEARYCTPEYSTHVSIIHFQCGHAGRRLIKHCHFARNDPNHQCFGAWSVKREWVSANQVCQSCGQQQAMMRRAQQAQMRA